MNERAEDRGLRAKLERVSARLRERILPPRVDEIRYANFAVTFLCNSRCQMCDIWTLYRQDPMRARGELTLAEIRGVFRSPLLRGLRAIALTGGEVFLRRDFVEICGFFLTEFPRATITIPTGAINPELNARALRRILTEYRPEPGRLYLSVSLDGVGETHDRQRGIRVYEKAWRVIEEALALGGIRVGVSFTITRENWRDLERVYELARARGLGFNAQFAQNSETYYARTDVETTWPLEDLRAIARVLERVAMEHLAHLSWPRRALDVQAYYLRRMTVYEARPRRLFTCYSGTHSFYLNPYGDVYPCVVLNKRLGNVRERSFEEIWLSPEAERVRRSIAARECACWTACEAMPSLGRSLRPVWENLMAFRASRKRLPG
ncbi:MAG: SPASM domain-containing protein [Blastocatellia bacterium]|nr:SPASM domain-containing protein [Blastocatellia bacterium]